MVFRENDHVLLVPPPGAAVLSTQQTRWLRTVLDQAAVFDMKRRVS